MKLNVFKISSLIFIILSLTSCGEDPKILELETQLQKMRIMYSGQVAIYESEKQAWEQEKSNIQNELDNLKLQINDLQTKLDNANKIIEELNKIPQKRSEKIIIDKKEYYVDMPLIFSLTKSEYTGALISYDFNIDNNYKNTIEPFRLDVYNRNTCTNDCGNEIIFDRMKYDFTRGDKYVENDIIYELYKIGEGYYYVKNNKGYRMYITFVDDLMFIINIKLTDKIDTNIKITDDMIRSADTIISKVKVYK